MPPSFLGPLYHPWWRKRLAFLLVLSAYAPALVFIAGISSGNPKATVGGMVTGALIAYVMQVGIILFLAPNWIPREIKEEWEYRRVKADARKGNR